MAERFTAALDGLADRLGAIGAEDEGVTVIRGDPDVILRALLSGYVPAEETDQAVQFVEECATALIVLLSRWSGPPGEAGVRMTVGQVLALGVMLGRQEDGWRDD